MSQEFDPETVMNNVESLKSRIIRTDALFSNLTAAQEELQVQANTIKSLQDSLANSVNSAQKYQTELSLLKTKYNNLKNSQSRNTNNDQRRALHIQQLNAKFEALEKGSEGTHQCTHLKKLQKDLDDKNKEVAQLKSDLEEERESSEKMEEELTELQLNNDMLKADFEEMATELKEYKEKYALMEQKNKPPTSSQDDLKVKLLKAEEKAKKAEEKLRKADEKTLMAKKELMKAENRACNAEDRACKAEERALRAEGRVAKAEERACRTENNNCPAPSANNSEELDVLKFKYRGLQADLKMTKAYNEHLQKQQRELLLKEYKVSEDLGSSSAPIPLVSQTIPIQVQETPSAIAQLQTNPTPAPKTTSPERPRPQLKAGPSNMPSIYMKRRPPMIPEHKKENPGSQKLISETLSGPSIGTTQKRKWTEAHSSTSDKHVDKKTKVGNNTSI